MLIAGFPAAAFGTNCYVVAPAAGEQCIVVDPGMGVSDALHAILAEHRLQPVAVLLTHGHLDHTMSVAPVCGARGIPAWIHAGDRAMLTDPMPALSDQTRAMFGGRLEWTEPDDVRIFDESASIEVAGLAITVDHAPGHTPGSVMFGLASDAERPPVLLSGDVLFAGSIGRTDLPGGSHEQMLDSLARKVLPLADETVVLPGHGESTTIGAERVSNPYLAPLSTAAAPNRGL